MIRKVTISGVGEKGFQEKDGRITGVLREAFCVEQIIYKESACQAEDTR